MTDLDAVALPLHYPYGLATIGHLGLIYLDLAIFIVDIALGLRAFMGEAPGAAQRTPYRVTQLRREAEAPIRCARPLSPRSILLRYLTTKARCIPAW